MDNSFKKIQSLHPHLYTFSKQYCMYKIPMLSQFNATIKHMNHVIVNEYIQKTCSSSIVKASSNCRTKNYSKIIYRLHKIRLITQQHPKQSIQTKKKVYRGILRVIERKTKRDRAKPLNFLQVMRMEQNRTRTDGFCNRLGDKGFRLSYLKMF